MQISVKVRRSPQIYVIKSYCLRQKEAICAKYVEFIVEKLVHGQRMQNQMTKKKYYNDWRQKWKRVSKRSCMYEPNPYNPFYLKFLGTVSWIDGIDFRVLVIRRTFSRRIIPATIQSSFPSEHKIISSATIGKSIEIFCSSFINPMEFLIINLQIS